MKFLRNCRKGGQGLLELSLASRCQAAELLNLVLGVDSRHTLSAQTLATVMAVVVDGGVVVGAEGIPEGLPLLPLAPGGEVQQAVGGEGSGQSVVTQTCRTQQPRTVLTETHGGSTTVIALRMGSHFTKFGSGGCQTILCVKYIRLSKVMIISSPFVSINS